MTKNRLKVVERADVVQSVSFQLLQKIYQNAQTSRTISAAVQNAAKTLFGDEGMRLLKSAPVSSLVVDGPDASLLFADAGKLAAQAGNLAVVDAVLKDERDLEDFIRVFESDVTYRTVVVIRGEGTLLTRLLQEQAEQPGAVAAPRKTLLDILERAAGAILVLDRLTQAGTVQQNLGAIGSHAAIQHALKTLPIVVGVAIEDHAEVAEAVAATVIGYTVVRVEQKKAA